MGTIGTTAFEDSVNVITDNAFDLLAFDVAVLQSCGDLLTSTKSAKIELESDFLDDREVRLEPSLRLNAELGSCEHSKGDQEMVLRPEIGSDLVTKEAARLHSTVNIT